MTAADTSIDAVLTAVSAGQISLADAARDLGLPDIGHLLASMRERELPLPAIDPAEADRQAIAGLEPLKAAMKKAP